ncbi:MAG: S41 family peptidase [Candidatus Paceibacterota bacterium]
MNEKNEQYQSEVEKKPRTRDNGLLGIGLAIVLASAAFFSGLQIGGGINSESQTGASFFSFLSASAPSEEEVEMDEFWRVWELLDEKFVSSTTTDAVSNEDKLNGAIKGLVGSYGDPYTVFLPPDDANQFEEDISGNFGGVGMEVGLRGSVVTVISPLPETPADRAGIIAGDVIVSIDDTSTKDMTIDEAVKLIRGEKGTEVTLELFREGEDELIKVSVVRDTISIPTVDSEQIGDIFIIRLYSFNALAEMKMQEELRNFIQSDANKLILDLRGNPGGFLQSAVSIASYFLPTGKVIVRENFGEGKEEQLYRSRGKVIHEFTPDTMVVLINQGSASASEILAGALKEHDIATLIGETTFGKGSVQELVNLPQGSSLKVTIARWLTPEGVSFSNGGLEPTRRVPRTPQQMMEDEDPQQEAALEWLRGNHSVGSDPDEPVNGTEDDTNGE